MIPTHHLREWRQHSSSCVIVIVNTLRPRQNGRHFADDMFKCIFLNENVWIPIKIALKFVPKGSNNNNPALVQIMAWGRPGDKPLSEPMMIILLTHICVTRPQCVKCIVDSSTWRQQLWINNVTKTHLERVSSVVTHYFGQQRRKIIP